MTDRVLGSIAALLPALLVVTHLVSAGEEQSGPASLAEGNSGFALDLYAKLRSGEGNLFFSPYSVSSALAMTYAGAREETAEEMARTLRFALPPEQLHPTFSELAAALEAVPATGNGGLGIANSLWPQTGQPLLPEYEALMERCYGSTVTPVDFRGATEEARRTINAWVEERTRDRIRELIGPGRLGPLTRLVLVNAIHFKGSWASRFDPERTTDSEFTLGDGRKVPVSLMHQTGKFGYGEIRDARLVELPYRDGSLSMVVILPDDPAGLPALEARLSGPELTSWLTKLSEQQVNLALPRFRMTWGTHPLNEPLQALGMKRAFGPEADFSGIDGTRSLSIGWVLHQAFIEVDEEGTEAAAATAVTMKRGAPRIHRFRAHHPFLLLIRDQKTGSILFLGRLVDPS